MISKKVLFVTIDLQGGTGVFIQYLASGLAKHYPTEFTCQLLTMREPRLAAEYAGAFSDVRHLGGQVRVSWSEPFEALALLPRMRQAIGAMAPDVILSAGNFANLLSPMAAGNVPCLLTVHSSGTNLLAESRLAPVLGPMLAWRYSRSRVVAPSQGVADDLRDNFLAGDVHVIPHGIDRERIVRRAEYLLADVPDRPYLLSVGRLTSAKDYPTLLRAYAIALKRNFLPPLVIVGDGELREGLLKLRAELRLNHHVQFLGHRDNPYPFMRSAEFFLLSSIWEGFGLALIEAMSLGIPCISTDCPSGPGEILDGGRYGILVPPGNVEKLAAAILRMCQAPERDKFASLAKKRSEEFDLFRMASAYRTLLRSSDTLIL
ncbi:MAG TPA: glycosyltransferase [Tepidisphaeraceae bacterium]|nr:glycosyltransferase [Tepidisphaeraceae bacterium]